MEKGPWIWILDQIKTTKLTCHDRIVEVFRCRVQVHHLDGAVEGPAVLDHGGAVGALRGDDQRCKTHRVYSVA